jgi:hypothetical protein
MIVLLPHQFKCLVSHSLCSLRENPKFLPNFRSKNNTLEEKLWLIILFNICHCNSGLAFKSKTITLLNNMVLYVFHKIKFPKVSQKLKWALWMRPLFIGRTWPDWHAQITFNLTCNRQTNFWNFTKLNAHKYQLGWKLSHTFEYTVNNRIPATLDFWTGNWMFGPNQARTWIVCRRYRPTITFPDRNFVLVSAPEIKSWLETQH